MYYSNQVPFDDSDETDQRKRLVFIGIGLAAAVFVIVVVAVFLLSNAPATFSVQTGNAVENSHADNAQLSERTIVVHVLGCVQSPGVYEVPEGCRIADVVDRAGGLTEEASQEAVNLAAIATDGMQIIIHSQETAQNAAGQVSSSEAASVAGKININTASSEQLQTLTGIGQATADKIISYRQKNGRFSSIDDLINVSGIGEKRLASLREFITV